MRYLGYVAAAGALAVALAGCGDPYYPRYGSSQSYYSQSPGYSYYPSGPTYGSQSRSDYYRNYNGIHPGAERTFP
jgi:hypothetical protein